MVELVVELDLVVLTVGQIVVIVVVSVDHMVVVAAPVHTLVVVVDRIFLAKVGMALQVLFGFYGQELLVHSPQLVLVHHK
jgi:hypothetical protein